MTSDRKALRRKPSRRSLSLPTHVLVMIAGALALLALMLWLLMDDRTSPLSANPNDQTVLEVVRLSFYAVAGVGGVIALTVAYRRQRMSEAEVEREDAKLFNERFAAAAEQLASERAANRLAGVYALAALADDWIAGRQTCVDVLCAYMRMPYEPPPPRSVREEAGLEPYRGVLEERLVRKTVMTVIGRHLEPFARLPWHDCHFDFTGATFDEGDLHGAVFKGRVTFDYARFPIAHFDLSGAQFHEELRFRNARFTGARVSLQACQFLAPVDFSGVKVAEGQLDLRHTDFHGVQVDFDGAVLSGGSMPFDCSRFAPGTRVRFEEAAFSGTAIDFWNVDFEGARLDFGRPADWSRPPRFDDRPDGPPSELILPTIDQ